MRDGRRHQPRVPELWTLGIIEHHEKNDRKDIVCYLHRFCV